MFYGSERNARLALRTFAAEIADGRSRATRGALSHILAEYLDALVAAGRSPNTITSNRMQIHRHINPGIGHIPLADLTAAHLTQHYDREAAAGVAPSSIGLQHSIISAAITRAQKRGWLGDRPNPAKLADRPTVSRPKPRPPTPAEVLRLIDEADRRNPDLAVLLFLSAMTGCRRGEACALRWSNVDLEQGRLTVGGSVWAVDGKWGIKSTKTGEDRRVSLDAATVAALELHRRRQAMVGVVRVADPFLFSPDEVGWRPYNPSNVTGFFQRTREAVGLPHVKLHDLRKFMASELLGAGFDVRTVASRGGWSDARVLLDVYAAFMPAVDVKAAQTMGALVKPKFLE